MARILSPEADNPNGDSKPDLGIRITIPEEFVGFAIGQVNQHDGVVTGMEIAQEGWQVIQASLPRSQFDSLSHEIVSSTIKGKVEREP